MARPEDLLDIAQAAAFLNVSETSLRRWTNAGLLHCLRVGGRRERRFRRADLLSFMEEQGSAEMTLRPLPPPERGHTVVDGVAMGHGTHLCGLYANDLARIKQSVSFLADGIRPGSACFLFAEREACVETLARLREFRENLDEDIEAGLLVATQYRESVDEQYALLEELCAAARAAGATSMRMVGDLAGIAKALNSGGLVEFEARMDQHFCARHPLVTLCQYDVRRFSGVELFNALKGHRDSFRFPIDRLLS